MADQITINVTDTIPPVNQATIDLNGNTGNTYSKTQLDEWKAIVELQATTSFGGILMIADVPAITSPIWFYAGESGTYTNAGGEVVDIVGKVVILSYDGSDWSQLETTAIGAMLSTDLEFKNKVDNKAMSPNQLFKVVGDFDYDSTTIPVVMDEPVAGFNLAFVDTVFASGNIWTHDPALWAHFEAITSIEVNWLAAGEKFIFIYNKSNLTTYESFITVNTPIGIHTHVFTTPINPETHLVAIADGGGYYVNGSATSAVRILGGQMNYTNTVVIGFKLYGTQTSQTTPTLINRIIDIENDVLDITPKEFTNNLYLKKNAEIINISNESGGSTNTLGAGGLTISSIGIGNGVVLEKPTNLNKRFLELKAKLFTDTKIYLGTKAVEYDNGRTFVVFDCLGQKMDIHRRNATSDVVATKPIAFTIVNGREYILRLFKNNIKTAMQIIDTVTGLSEFLEDSTYNEQYDKYKFGVISSSSNIVISKIAVKSIINERPYIIFYGDSNTEGADKSTRFADLIGTKLNKPYLVSGRGSGTIDGVIGRMSVELPILLPEWVFITIGTNGGNTESKLNQMIDFCESYGIKVILNTVPLYDASTAGINTIIQTVINARGLPSVQFHRATSINGDGVTKDNSLYYNEAGTLIHLNEAGNLRVLDKSLSDVPELFTEVGVY